MAKVRVHELAKELGVESKVVLTKLSEMGEFVKSASSTVEPPVVKRFNDTYGAELRAAAEAKAAKKATAKKPPAKPEPDGDGAAAAETGEAAGTTAPVPGPARAPRRSRRAPCGRPSSRLRRGAPRRRRR